MFLILVTSHPLLYALARSVNDSYIHNVLMCRKLTPAYLPLPSFFALTLPASLLSLFPLTPFLLHLLLPPYSHLQAPLAFSDTLTSLIVTMYC